MKANKSLSIDKIYDGTATTSVLGNVNAPVIADVTSFYTNVWNPETETAAQDIYVSKTRITGTLYVKSIIENIEVEAGTAGQIILGQVGSDQTIAMTFNTNENQWKVREAARKLGVEFDDLLVLFQ